jgi:hypothetical protein
MDKEDRVAILKKLLQLEEQNGVDESFMGLFNDMSKALNNYESIDKEMVARLNDMFSNDLIKKKEYSDIVKAITEGSTVVYFKSAQLFKVYKQSELETLLGGQLRTIYKEFNESYELVSNNAKQKIVILCDTSLTDRIESIKTYIVDFMTSEGLTDFCDSDIVCYKRKDGLEIIINDYYVENQKEHNEIVQRLLNYIMTREKNTNIVQRISTSNYSEFDGVKMIPMPSDKELIATKYIEPILTMISNVQQCNGFKHITVNLTVNNNIDNSTNTTNINNPESSDQINNDIDDFIEHIVTDKPKWYTENKWVLFSMIYDNYADYIDDPVTKQMFSVYTYNKLYTRRAQKVINKKKGRAVLLFSYKSLEN